MSLNAFIYHILSRDTLLREVKDQNKPLMFEEQFPQNNLSSFRVNLQPLRIINFVYSLLFGLRRLGSLTYWELFQSILLN
jgi:hypothetical protein